MYDSDDDARYPPKQHKNTNYAPSSQRSKFLSQNFSYPHSSDPNSTYHEDGEDEDDEDREISQESDDFIEDDVEDDDEDYERHFKKRKLQNVADNCCGLAPRNRGLEEWTEHETFVLLEAWGERYLQLGRKSLRSDDWCEVAERVSELSKVERTDSQCRNRLDTLKKRYKKEKARREETGDGSKWVFFKKMDMLLSASPKQQCGLLACGVDSGEYVFMDPEVYLSCSNALDEMRDSPGNSESYGSDDDGKEGEDYGGEGNGDLDGIFSRKTKDDGRGKNQEGSSSSPFRMLVDSIQKFGEIYEKIEDSKREQMMELEKMRMEFSRELELQKNQILNMAQAELEKIQQGGDEEDNSGESAENISE